MTEGIGQAGVEVPAEIAIGDLGEFLHKGTDFLETAPAITAHDQRPGVGDGVPEGFRGLPGQYPPAGIGKGHRYHQRHIKSGFFRYRLNGENGGLDVQGIEDGFHQQQVGAAKQQLPGRLGVVFGQLIEADIARLWGIHIGHDGGGAWGRAQHPGHKARFLGRLPGFRIRGGTRQAHRRAIDFGDQSGLVIVRLGQGGGIETVGADDVRPDIEIGPVYAADQLGAG